MPDVTLPDGTIVQNVPDTPEARAQLAAAWQRKSAAAPAAAAGAAAPSPAGVRPEFLGSAFARGLANTPALFLDALGAMTNEREDPSAGPMGNLLPVSQLVPNIGVSPQNGAERMAGSAVEGGVSALTTPGGGGIVRGVAAKFIPGATAGLGADVAGQLFPEQGDAARFAGGLAGGVAGGLTGLLRSGKEDLARTTIRGVETPELEMARDRMAAMRDAGTPVTAAQAMERPGTPVEAMSNALANKGTGKKTQDILSAQPGVATKATEELIMDMPGKIGVAPASPMLRSALDQGTVPGASMSQILAVQKKLAARKGGNEAYQNTVKTWLAEKLASSRQTSGIGDNANFASAMNNALGSKGTAANQGMLDALTGLARSQKLPDETYIKGMNNLRAYIAMSAKRPGSVGNISSDLHSAGSGTSQEFVRAGTFSWLYEVRKKISELRGAAAERFVDDLLTTPEGMDTLVQFSKNPVMSRSAATTLATMLGIETDLNETPAQ